MKKVYILYVLFVLIFVGCDVTNMKVVGRSASDSIQIIRYDRVEARYLTTGDFAALQEMNTAYPTMTRALIEDLLVLGEVNDININKALLDYFQDATLQDVIYAAESEFADMEDVASELKEAFRCLRNEIPNIHIPVFYAQIGAFHQSIVVDDDAIGISLDKYLGEDYQHYKRFYDRIQRKTMTREFIAADCLVFYLLSKFSLPDYETCSQRKRDLHMGAIMWVTNKLLGRIAFRSQYINKVDKYMKANTHVSIEQLLDTKDYSRF